MSRLSPPRRSVFRFGALSIGLSLFTVPISAIAALATNRFGISPLVINDALEFMWSLNLFALWLGIAGVFQRNGRTISIEGIVFSICNLIFLPVLFLA